jgi:uncharacterized protein (DUF362 family)
VVSQVDRRTFLKNSSLLAGAIITGREVEISQPTTLSRVVLAHRSDVRTSGNKISGDNVQKLLDSAVENYFQKTSLLAWSQFINKYDMVGLKVNCLAGKGLSTSIEIVQAVVERLLQLGVAKQKIIIWDRLDSDLQRAGYSIYRGSAKPQCYGNDSTGYTSEIFEYGSVGSQLSRIIYEQCTAVVNIPVMKDHGICGISIGLKNLFGAINNPNKYHDSVGDPYIADVNMLPQIRQKIRLTICDALTPQYEGGPPFMPQWTWQMDSLLLAQDMVALDHSGWQIVEQQRKKAGLPNLKACGREPTYIATAANAAHGLGTNDPAKIELLKV